jgi:hypothetical protein
MRSITNRPETMSGPPGLRCPRPGGNLRHGTATSPPDPAARQRARVVPFRTRGRVRSRAVSRLAASPAARGRRLLIRLDEVRASRARPQESQRGGWLIVAAAAALLLTDLWRILPH